MSEERKSLVKDYNFFVINGFMINKLNLSGSNLLVFAIIFGFCQDKKSLFTGTRQYIADFTGLSKRTIQRALEDLCNMGYIIKHTKNINNVILNEYDINHKYISKLMGEPYVEYNDIDKDDNDAVDTGVDKMSTGVEKKSTNNINNNINNNIYKNNSACTHEYIDNNLLENDNNTSNIEKDEKPSFIDNGYTSNIDFLPTTPTLQEIQDYCRLKSFTFNTEMFFNYYEGIGWKMNGRFIENWQAVANNWQLKEDMKNRYRETTRNSMNYSQNNVKPTNPAPTPNKSPLQTPIIEHEHTKEELENAFGERVDDDDI